MDDGAEIRNVERSQVRDEQYKMHEGVSFQQPSLTTTIFYHSHAEKSSK
jgi:hypothetical protein